jgi:hypothetical protein
MVMTAPILAICAVRGMHSVHLYSCSLSSRIRNLRPPMAVVRQLQTKPICLLSQLSSSMLFRRYFTLVNHNLAWGNWGPTGLKKLQGKPSKSLNLVINSNSQRAELYNIQLEDRLVLLFHSLPKEISRWRKSRSLSLDSSKSVPRWARQQ